MTNIVETLRRDEQVVIETLRRHRDSPYARIDLRIRDGEVVRIDDSRREDLDLGESTG